MILTLFHHDKTQQQVDVEGFMETLVSPELLERQETADARDLQELEAMLTLMTEEELTRFRAGTRRTADLAERIFNTRFTGEVKPRQI